MPIIQIKNINQGGIADSEYAGLEQSLAEVVGVNVHQKSGLVRVNQALTDIDEGGIIDDDIRSTVSSSDGNQYLFAYNNGNLWKRDGVTKLLSLVTTLTGGIKGAEEYRGYIYYATPTTLGRVAVGSPTDWTARDDSFGTFANGDADWHPMRKLNRVLYIGDRNFVAQVDADSLTLFQDEALDIAEPLRIKSLGQLGTDLLIGTFVNDNINSTEVLRWNTWSPSFTNSDPIPEIGINAFLATDNFVIVSAGVKGRLYTYNGSQLEEYKQIAGEWEDAEAMIHPEATINFNGLPLFGLSTQKGNPCTMGVYSLGRTNYSYPYVLITEYLISKGVKEGVDIGSLTYAGDVFIVTWRSGDEGKTHGVDVLDLTKKHEGAYITTRLSLYDRVLKSNYGFAQIAYRSKPDGTGFTVDRSINHEAFENMSPLYPDENRKLFYTKAKIGDATTLQMKVGFVVNGNDAPDMELFQFEVE